MTEEDKYESIELIVKARQDGEPWFDIISSLISDGCEGTEDIPCSCGLESMGGSSGTLEQCYDHMRTSEKWATVKTEDLKLILKIVKEKRNELLTGKEWKAYDRLLEEAYWHQKFDEWLDNLPDDDDE